MREPITPREAGERALNRPGTANDSAPLRCCHRPGGRSTLPTPPPNNPLPGSRFIFRMGRFDRQDFPPNRQISAFVLVSRSTGPTNARPPLRSVASGSFRAEILAPLSCFPVQKKQDRRRFKMKIRQTLTFERLLALQRETQRISNFTSFGRAAKHKELRCLADKMLAAIDLELAEGGDSQ